MQTLLPNGSVPPGDSLEDGAKYDFAGRIGVEEFQTLVAGSSFTKRVQKDICSNSLSKSFWSEEFGQRGFLAAIGTAKKSFHLKKKFCPKAKLVDSWRALRMLCALAGIFMY